MAVLPAFPWESEENLFMRGYWQVRGMVSERVSRSAKRDANGSHCTWLPKEVRHEATMSWSLVIHTLAAV